MNNPVVDQVKTYNQIEGADSFIRFVMSNLSEEVQYRIYKDLKKNRPDLVGDVDHDASATAEQRIWDHVHYFFYTAAYNLGHALVHRKQITNLEFEQDFLDR